MAYLNDEQKLWILKYNGKEITHKLIKLLKDEKIDLETYKLAFLFWMSEHNIS